MSGDVIEGVPAVLFLTFAACAVATTFFVLTGTGLNVLFAVGAVVSAVVAVWRAVSKGARP